MEQLLNYTAPKLEKCLIGFHEINRFWDRRRNAYVAKILPGEFYVTRSSEMIATTLGSCVSACIWDDKASIGGMNHFMLPLTNSESHEVTWGNVASKATRYGNYAMEHLINELLKNGASRQNLKAKVFGGAKVIKQLSDVGARNSIFVIEYLQIENITLMSEDLRDIYPRKVLFDPLTGQVLMKALRTMHNDTISDRERIYQDQIVRTQQDGDVELF